MDWPCAPKTGSAGYRCPGWGPRPQTHVLEEDAEIRVGPRIDGGLEHREENVLQHFAKVGNKVPASEDVTKSDRGNRKNGLLIKLLHVFLVKVSMFLHGML